jgi:NAD+ synthase (glutamine-hydrolysing)
MHIELAAYLHDYRKTRAFNVEKWVTYKISELNNYMKKYGLKACVVGCSGGIDSAVTFALCMKAMKFKDSPIKHVVPVLMPMDPSKSETYKRAIQLCNTFNATPFTDEIVLQAQTMMEKSCSSLSNWMKSQTESDFDDKSSKFSYGQLQSYLRTPHLYFTAQLMTQHGFPAVVMGTGNMDEDGYLGYFCKAGDGVVDIQLINDCHKSEVFTIARHLGVPESILTAKPTADLWEGQTDEEEIGVSYDFVELFTGDFLKKSYEEQKEFLASLNENARKEFDDFAKKCVEVHLRNRHKLTGIVNL